MPEQYTRPSSRVTATHSTIHSSALAISAGTICQRDSRLSRPAARAAVRASINTSDTMIRARRSVRYLR